MQITTVRLTRSQRLAVQSIARNSDMSESAVVRQAIQFMMSNLDLFYLQSASNMREEALTRDHAGT